MIQVEEFVLGPLATNAYLLRREGTNRAVVIDPGMDADPLMEHILEQRLQVEAIVLTHAHFDHIAGVDMIRDPFGCPVYIHEAEAEWLTDAEKNGSLRWPDVTPPIVVRPAEMRLRDGEILMLLDEPFRLYHTPGHSPGSVSLHWNDLLFSGDVLFQMSVGRTDLPGGNAEELYDSIHEVLFTLDPGTIVLPGHGPRTTIGFEQENNPFV